MSNMKRTYNPFLLALKLILLVAALPAVIAAALVWAAVIFGKSAVKRLRVNNSQLTIDN